MATSSKFWVLFANYVRGKLETCIDSKEKVRRQIVEYFFEENLTSDDGKQQSFLKKHLDDLLYLPELNDASAAKDLTEQKKPKASANALCNPFDLEPTSGVDDEDMAPAAQFGMIKRQERIECNLEEIQQEEEIIFIDDRWRHGFNAQ